MQRESSVDCVKAVSRLLLSEDHELVAKCFAAMDLLFRHNAYSNCWLLFFFIYVWVPTVQKQLSPNSKKSLMTKASTTGVFAFGLFSILLFYLYCHLCLPVMDHMCSWHNALLGAACSLLCLECRQVHSAEVQLCVVACRFALHRSVAPWWLVWPQNNLMI